MSYSPTIIAASLDDKELQESINKMVANFDRGLKSMLDNTNTKVNAINEALKKVGVTNVSTKGSDDSGAAKRTKAQNAETDAIEKNVAARDRQIKKNQETAMSFDQMAAAMQKASRMPSEMRPEKPETRARDSYYAFVAGLKEQRDSLAKVINDFERGLNNAISKRTNEINNQITASKNKIQELNQELNRANATRNAARASQVQGQLDKELRHYRDLESQLKNVNNEFTISKISLAAMNAEHHRLANLMREETQVQQQQAQTTQQRITEEQKVTDEIRRQAQAIRESKQWREKGVATVGNSVVYNAETNTSFTNKQKQALGTLEEQLLRIQQQQAAEQQRIAASTQETANAEQKVVSEAERRLQIEGSMQETLRKSREIMREMEAQKGGSVATFTPQLESLNKLSARLKDLRKQYNEMSFGERFGAEGQKIAQNIRIVTRETQKLQAQLARPANLKEALGLPAKTLDDIAYKMRQLSAYRSGLDVDKQKGDIEQINKAYTSLQKKMNEVMQKNESLVGSNTALLRSWNYMKNRLAFYFTVGASTQFIKNLIEVRSQYEMNERALGILIDSAERGTQIFNELSQMALVSPYTLIELSTAAKQLTAYDVAAKDVVDTTRRLADMAAAVGIPIERLTYALGQIKAYGYLNSRDARMFANAGIPLVKQLSDYYTELEGKLVSTADVYDRIKKKAIDYNEVMEVINKMTDQGGKFFDFQAKMADTLKVRLANLTLAWNNMLNDMGKEEQGVLTWGIGALREMFLHWKQLDSLIKNAAWALGIRTALMFIAWGALKAGNAFGIMSKQMALSAVFGTKLANVLKNVGYSVIALAKNKWTWISLFAVAAVEASKALLGVNEAQKALNESIRNGAKDNYNNIKKFSEQYQEVRETLYKSNGAGGRTPVDIDNNEAKKVWDAIREQIELTVTSSDEYIGRLLSIENMSERVRQAFNLLDDVQVVNAALQEIDDDTIKVTQDWDSLLGTALLPEGLISDLKDFVKEENSIIEKFGSLSAAREKANQENEHARVNLQDYDAALKEFRSELEKTTQSVLNFIQVKGWSGDEGKINQVFEQITQKIVLDNQLDPQKAFTLQTEVEEARSEAAKQALLQRINDEKAAYKISHDEQLRQSINADIARYNSWSETNGRSKVEWERFTKWLKEQHISETTAMFRNMDAEDIKSLNFQEGKHAEWVTRMVTQYAKEHKMSYDEAFKYLKNWVRSANQWSIFIPLTISTEDKKSVYDQLGEYDKAIDEADAQIERLTKRIGELNAKKQKSKEETQELANAEQELADAQKAKADAEAKGGHGKKEKKDEKAAEKAARKAAKQSETELQKALKDELSVIEKVRSIYKELTKEGMSHADAVELATEGWDETVNAINRILQKNGLQRLDLAKFVGVANPRELVNMLQSQLDVLVRRGAKPAEIKDFQAKIQTLKVDASKYDLTMITNGLNNELSKLKDEYELAVALDADPEMGNLFAEMFGINTETLPKTIKEYADKATEYLNKFLEGNKSDFRFGAGELFSLTQDDIDAFQSQVSAGTFNQAWFDVIKKAYDDINGKRQKELQDIFNKTKELEYKLADVNGKIAIEQKKLSDLQIKWQKETNEQKKHYLELQIQDQKNAIEQLEMESVKLMPFYEELFGDMYNLSTRRLKEIIANAKQVMKPQNFVTDPSGQGYVQRTIAGKDGKNKVVYDIFSKDADGKIKKTTVSLDEYRKINKQIASVQKEVAEKNPWEKIKDSFSKDENGKIKNVAAGIEAIGGEISKMGQLTGVIGEIFASFSNPDEYNETAEVLGDISATMDGLGQAAQGVAQIYSGDIIGGATNVIKGLWTSISAWFDNTDKIIQQEIKDSEKAVKRLENSYKDLEFAVEHAYGMAEYGAKRAVIANKQLQLVEMQRQLRLEQSRESKYRDNDKILELKGSIIDLRNEIKQSIDDITNDLLGITSVGDAAEQLVSSMIDAFRQGEDYMTHFDESFEDMIDNMIMKAIVSRVIGDRLDAVWEQVKQTAEVRGEAEKKRVDALTKQLSDAQDKQMTAQAKYDNTVQEGLGQFMLEQFQGINTQKDLADANAEVKRVQALLKQAEKDYAEAIALKPEDVQGIRDSATSMRDDVKAQLEAFMEAYGIKAGDRAEDKNLSNLQQGISQVTEDTAGALEAITNGISQQCYLQSDLLTQIRDTVQGFDLDVQLGVQSQMLLQLQQSFAVHQSIQSILESVLTPNGRSFSVELAS